MRGLRVVCVLVSLALLMAGQASGGTLFGSRHGDGEIFTIDTDSLAITDLGASGVVSNFGGMAWDPNSSTMYLLGGRNNPNLYTVDPASGVATLVGSHGLTDLLGLGYDCLNDVLYGGQFSGGTGLYTLNVTTAAATKLADLTFGLEGLAYDSLTDDLIGFLAGQGDLYSIDRTSFVISLLQDGAATNDGGLAFDQDKNLIWQADINNRLWSYDPTNSYTQTLRIANTGVASLAGLTYMSSSCAAGDPGTATATPTSTPTSTATATATATPSQTPTPMRSQGVPEVPTLSPSGVVLLALLLGLLGVAVLIIRRSS